MSNGTPPIAKAKGRPARYLLSGIAVCGVCGASMRIGAQNSGKREPESRAQRERYRVYECAGLPGQRGFHVSMRQEHLDEIVTEAVLIRAVSPDFKPPRTLAEHDDNAERQALRLQIKADRIWLDSVREEADRRGTPRLLAAQEKIVLPKIEAAHARLDKLEELDPVVLLLKRTASAKLTWLFLSIAERRHIVRALLTPRVNAVTPEDLGQRGINTSRVELVWRDETR